MEHALRLFKALEISSKRTKKPSEKLVAACANYGFVYGPRVVANYSEDKLIRMVKKVGKAIGITGKEANNSFHKSWGKIKDSSDQQLVFEQIVHYLTTYGFAHFGIYDQSTVYVPKEELDVPGVDLKKIRLTVIHGYTDEEMKEKTMGILRSGIALNERSIDDIIHVLGNSALTDEDVSEVRNKEVMCILCSKMDLVPSNPSEFLRYLVYRSTNSMLLIKDKATISALGSSPSIVGKLLKRYCKEHSPVALARIFNRFKPIFMAIKSADPSLINKISKLSKKHHVPMHPDYLNEVTAMIRQNITVSEEKLKDALDNANPFRKARLAQALSFRLTHPEAIVYRIRNGKQWSTKYNGTNSDRRLHRALRLVTDSIIETAKKSVKDKTILIPEDVSYALPTTDKMFVGNVPSGSHLTIKGSLIAGVHWTNLTEESNWGEGSVDLDLSFTDISGKIGWNTRFRDESRDIMFSGDMTDAPLPKGASEWITVRDDKEVCGILTLNPFRPRKAGVPYKIIVGNAPEGVRRKHIVDPNDIRFVVPTETSGSGQVFGLITSNADEKRFYFVTMGSSSSRVSIAGRESDLQRQYLLDYYSSCVSLENILVQAGAQIVREGDCDVDMSLENIQKDAVITLLGGK